MLAFIESLESRKFLSANPLGVKSPPQTIAADQAAVVAARAAIPADKGTWNAQLRVDRANIPAVSAAGKAAIRSAQVALGQARGNPVEAEIARGELLVAKGNAKSSLADAKAQIKIDTGNARASFAADEHTLALSLLKLKEDRIAK